MTGDLLAGALRITGFLFAGLLLAGVLCVAAYLRIAGDLPVERFPAHCKHLNAGMSSAVRDLRLKGDFGESFGIKPGAVEAALLTLRLTLNSVPVEHEA